MTDEMVETSDRLQGELGEGPCFDAARRVNGDRVFRIVDMAQPQPLWPSYAPAARKLGIGSMMGFLLYTDDQDFGALNCYSGRAGAFTPESETAGWLLASHAAVALASARTVDQLEHAAPLPRGDAPARPGAALRAPRGGGGRGAAHRRRPAARGGGGAGGGGVGGGPRGAVGGRRGGGPQPRRHRRPPPLRQPRAHRVRGQVAVRRPLPEGRPQGRKTAKPRPRGRGIAETGEPPPHGLRSRREPATAGALPVS